MKNVRRISFIVKNAKYDFKGRITNVKNTLRISSLDIRDESHFISAADADVFRQTYQNSRELSSTPSSCHRRRRLFFYSHSIDVRVCEMCWQR